MHLIIIFKDFKAAKPGVSHVGLGVSSQLTSAVLRKKGIEANAVPVICFEDILLYLSNNKHITHVVIAAPWVPVKDMEILLKQFPNVQFAVTCHSNFGFLAVEPAAIKLLRDYNVLQDNYDNFQVAANSEKFIFAWSRIYDTELAYLPNLYDFDPEKPVKHHKEEGVLKIGLFGSVRPLKNFVTAVAACMYISKVTRRKVDIYMSSGRDEGGQVTNRAIDELVAGYNDVKLIRSMWSDHDSFRKLVGEMDLLLQPSYTESFNLVTADGVAEGVPSVVSNAVSWVPSGWVANADNVSNIAGVALEILRNYKLEVFFGRNQLTLHNHGGILSWKEWLEEA